MSTIDQIKTAIALYEAGQKAECLAQIRQMLDTIPLHLKLAADLEVRSIDSGAQKSKQAPPEQCSPNHSLTHWLSLARDRLVKEVENPDEIAFVPVLTSLRTAIGLLTK